MSLVSAIFEFLAHWASVFWSTLRETGPFLVFGLVLAGVLHVLVPSRIVLWALGHGGWRGALRGALIGTPLPLCSCGVVPTALTLRRQGASLSATTAFTISTPETSIDALAITAALLPAVYLGVRPLAAIALAFIVGVVVEMFSTTTKERLRMNVMQLSRAIEKSADERREDTGSMMAPKTAEMCRVCGLMAPDEEAHSHGVFAKTRAIMEYAFGTFFRDIATWLMIGLVFAALIQVAVPTEAFKEGWLHNHPTLQILIAILIGIPLYSCATATTPLAAVLLTKGLAPGAALALLLAGPASNIGNVFALKRELGGRITALYYGALFVCCYLLGFAFNLLWPLVERFPALTSVAQMGWVSDLAHGMPGWIEVVSAWILILLFLKVLASSFFGGVHDHDGDDHDHHGHDHTAHAH